MPPTSGSTRRSATWGPKRRRTSSATLGSSGQSVRGQDQVEAGPEHPGRAQDARAQERAEAGRGAEHQALGEGPQAPADHRPAPGRGRGAPARRRGPAPGQRRRASGTRAMKASAPVSTRWPRKSSVWMRPPSGPGSNTVTSGRVGPGSAPRRRPGRRCRRRRRPPSSDGRGAAWTRSTRRARMSGSVAGQHAVAQVEDVARAGSGRGQHLAGRVRDHLPGGQADRRVEVALDGPAGPDPGAGPGRAGPASRRRPRRRRRRP